MSGAVTDVPGPFMVRPFDCRPLLVLSFCSGSCRRVADRPNPAAYAHPRAPLRGEDHPQRTRTPGSQRSTLRVAVHSRDKELAMSDLRAGTPGPFSVPPTPGQPDVEARTHADDADWEPEPEPTLWVGWIAYAGVMMLLLGSFHAMRVRCPLPGGVLPSGAQRPRHPGRLHDVGAGSTWSPDCSSSAPASACSSVRRGRASSA